MVTNVLNVVENHLTIKKKNYLTLTFIKPQYKIFFNDNKTFLHGF
jgi:hypothetical protein